MKTILVRLYLKDGRKRELRSTSAIRRILSTVSHVQFTKAFVRVGYGKKIDNHGKLVNFDNSGYFTDKEELARVMKVFWAED